MVLMPVSFILSGLLKIEETKIPLSIAGEFLLKTFLCFLCFFLRGFDAARAEKAAFAVNGFFLQINHEFSFGRDV
jgi:hypothetical protein